jgi:O-antigen biosynthesis protein
MGNIELIISANGCFDNSESYLRDLKYKFDSLGFEKNLKIIWNHKPLGFAKAVNEGIRQSSCEKIILLNNDVLLLAQQKNYWLELFESSFVNNDKCGISCIVKQHLDVVERDFAVFFCVMIHKKVFDKIGLISEDYDVGGSEDVDFSIQCENAGFEIVECSKNTIGNSHIVAGSFPIYHAGQRTIHDPELVKNYNETFHQNHLILAKKFNPTWFEKNK